MPRRFFISPERIINDTVTIEGPEAHHLRHVLRLKKGAHLELFDGTGNLYGAEITGFARSKAFLAIVSTKTSPRQKPQLHLAPALLKGKKFEFVLQKAVELGITALHPFFSTFSDRQPTKGNATGDRWQRIVLEACKQCGQPLLPHLATPVSFPTLLQNASLYSQALLCYEKETSQKVGDVPLLPLTDKAILLITGPEGGFSDSEISSALQQGCKTVSLGPLILRAETAALASVAIVQHRLGMLG